jgi:hypothetical protein
MLTVHFVSPDAPSRAEPARPANPSAADLGAEIAAVEGRGGVQVRLDGGVTPGAPASASPAETAWVYADALDGNGLTRQLAVTGEDVWVVRETIVADRMAAIRFDEANRVAESTGKGRVRAFPMSVAPVANATDSGRPTARPALPAQQAMVVEWSDGFRFDERAGPGGALELNGSVTVRSTPDRASTDAVDAAWLRVELVGELVGDGADAAPRGSATQDAAEAGIRRIVARGARGNDGSVGAPAVFASRRWTDESRSGDPRVLQLEGPEIAYDLVTREGSVVGAGKLLAHVPEATRDGGATAGVDRPEQAGETTMVGRRLGFGTTGTTRFTWRERLDLRAITMSEAATGPSRFRVELLGGVQMVHADTTGAAVPSLLTAARLEADFERLEEGGQAASDGAAGVDLTGTAKLLAVRGFGDGTARVQFDTGEFVVECDAFVYDTETQIATLTAAAGRSVVVVGTNPPGRRTAESVEWNLATGTLRVRNARGS